MASGAAGAATKRTTDGPKNGVDAVAGRLVRHLRGYRIGLSNETGIAQREIAEALAAGGFSFEREVRLGPGDIVDFLVPAGEGGGIALEVKLKGHQKRAIFRQLERYAAHQPVAGIVLASNIAMGLPEAIGGKPCWFVSLGRGWL